MSILDLFRVDGQVAVVTGSGRGIGRGIAIALAEAGADVVVTSRRSDDVAEVAGQVRARGRRALEVPGDLRDPAVRVMLADRTLDEFGRLDIWVNNAGGTDDAHVKPMTEVTDDELRDMLELNLIAAAACSREAALRMPEGGSIVNVSSGAGMIPARAGPHLLIRACRSVATDHADVPPPVEQAVVRLRPGEERLCGVDQQEDPARQQREQQDRHDQHEHHHDHRDGQSRRQHPAREGARRGGRRDDPPDANDMLGRFDHDRLHGRNGPRRTLPP